MTEPNPPRQGSTKDHCSVLADGEHYYGYHVGPDGHFRQCLSCHYVDASEMVAELAAQKRVLEAMHNIAEAFRGCLPVIQQLTAAILPLVTAMATEMERQAHPPVEWANSGVTCKHCGLPMWTRDGNNLVCRECGRTAWSA